VNCGELLRLLTEYEEGTLATPLCVEVTRHLGECGPCEELRHELHELTRLCRESPRPRLPEGLRRRIEELLRQSRQS
jgi:predicted anti-sigma-YlaC factor YlaD